MEIYENKSTQPKPWAWRRTKYGYDTYARPNTTQTVINDNGSVSLNSSLGYDSLGRLSTQTYPSGLVVQRSYTAYGQLDALYNAQTMYVYWVAQGHDAWGHVVAEQYPGLITGIHQDFDATGQTMTLGYSGSVSDTIGYKYDSFGNLVSQTRTAQSVTNTETYLYDNLQRLTQATRAIGGIVTYGYSPSGNINQKSDYASSYSYGTNGCGPHAVSAAGTNTYQCDLNGNVIGGSTITSAIYDADNHPRSITRNGATMTWGYSPSGMAVETSSLGVRYFGPNGYEQIGSGTSAKQIHELGPVIVTRTNGVDQITAVLRDRLGSTISTMDSNVPTGRMYDAFGNPRNGNMSNRGTLNLPDTIHGFTKHDHADDVQLIHMGGRVYDYQLGRFLNVDPLIQNPANSQSLNPYSYVGNNPLSGKDPTGYAIDCFGNTIFCSGIGQGGNPYSPQNLTRFDEGNGQKPGSTAKPESEGSSPSSIGGRPIQMLETVTVTEKEQRGWSEWNGLPYQSHVFPTPFGFHDFGRDWYEAKSGLGHFISLFQQQQYGPIGPYRQNPLTYEFHSPTDDLNMKLSIAGAFIPVSRVETEMASVAKPVIQDLKSVVDTALAAGRTSGAAAELRVGGEVFIDVSTGGAARTLHPDVEAAYEQVPLEMRAPWHGHCAEAGCLSQALNAGVDPAGGSSRAVNIGNSGKGHGTAKPTCSSCSYVLDLFGVKHD